jgi:exopolysaccharide biosynthesis protein
MKIFCLFIFILNTISCKTTNIPAITNISSAPESKTAEGGIQYEKIVLKREDGSVQYAHVVKVSDLKSNSFVVRSYEDFQKEGAVTPSSYAKSNSLKVSMNASFFDANYTPIGPTFSRNTEWETHIKPIYRSTGVFSCNIDNKCSLDYYDEFTKNNFNADKHYNAVTGFPIILRNGKTPSLTSDDRHPRSVVGLDKSRNLYFIVTDGRSFDALGGFKRVIGFSYKEMSRLLLGLGVTDALNLDGGGSSNIILNGNRVNLRKATNPVKKPDEVLQERKVPVLIGIK